MATSLSVAQVQAPILTPQVAALFVRHGEETWTGCSGAQEQREPKVDAARQLKQVAPAHDSAPADRDTQMDRGFMHAILAWSQTTSDERMSEAVLDGRARCDTRHETEAFIASSIERIIAGRAASSARCARILSRCDAAAGGA